MIVNKDTKLFFSVSEIAGNFGSLLYNSAFEKLNINAIYKPLQLNRTQNFNLFLEGLMYLKPLGLSISMPFKTKAYEYYSKRCPDPIVHEIKNVNTYKFTEDSYIVDCYNTDYYGFEMTYDSFLSECKTVAIFGDGAVSKTIQSVLRKKKISFSVVERRDNGVFPESDLLINATPIGMDGIEDTVFTKDIVKKYKEIFDVVVKKETNLSNLAKNCNVPYTSGVWMSYFQLRRQWNLYNLGPSPDGLFLKLLKENNYV